MLHGIHPLLTGSLLAALDEAGHSDGILVSDAHFPAARLGSRVVDLPGASAPEVVAAIRTVLVLDDYDGAVGLDLMASLDGDVLPVQEELMAAAQMTRDETAFVDRFTFYEEAASAFVIVRTGEVRAYGNALLRKGLVTPLAS
jgi:L-fucose mutarotase